MEWQRRGNTCYRVLTTVGVEQKSTHASKLCEPQRHEGIRVEAVLGPLGGGMDVTQFVHGPQSAPTLHSFAVCSEEQGIYASYTSVVYERVVDRKAQWCGGVIMPFVL